MNSHYTNPPGGNANFGNVMTRELHKKGFEVVLLIPKQMITGSLTQINDPLNYDKRLESYPEWVYDYDRTIRKKLVDYFKPHNERLNKLLGRDFGWDE